MLFSFNSKAACTATARAIVGAASVHTHIMEMTSKMIRECNAVTVAATDDDDDDYVDNVFG